MIRVSGGRAWIRLSTVAIVVFAMLLAAAPAATAGDAEDAQGTVDKALITFKGMHGDKDFKWMNEHLQTAKGVLIYPQVLKVGFVLGGSGGTGVLLRRDEKTGNWSNPGFYTMGAVSFGLQIGGESAEVILLVMTQKGMDSLLTSKFKLGGDVSIAAGPVGGGAKSDITADFISFAKSKGLYAGLNLEGSYLDVRSSLNNAYYGKETTPADIMIKQSVENPASFPLRDALKKAK